MIIHLEGNKRHTTWCGRDSRYVTKVYYDRDATCPACLDARNAQRESEAVRQAYVDSHDLDEWQPITRESLPLGDRWLFADYHNEVHAGVIENYNPVSGECVIWIGSSAHRPFDKHCNYTHYRRIPKGPKAQ